MIVFMTNYLNIHQLPFALNMYKKLRDDFKFVSMSRITDERLRMGFQDLDSMYSFVIKAYESDKLYREALELVNSCDVLIVGSVEDKYLFPRLNDNKLTLRYSERYFKYGYGIRAFACAMKHMLPFQKYKTLYYLCSSAYTAIDLNKYTRFKDKTFKWGYFPEVKHFDNIENLIKNKKKNSILWCSRMIDWKHPEVAVEIARKLKERNIEFELNMVGEGPLKKHIESRVNEYKLNNYVRVLGNKKPEEVRQLMEESCIFMFTSDRNEGWGAVLNESMNSACAVVASHEIGSVPYMIEDNINGYIYENGNTDELFNKVLKLIINENDRISISMNAYSTMIKKWNGENAVDNLLYLIDCLKNNKEDKLDKDEPCSIAPIIKENWYMKGK